MRNLLAYLAFSMALWGVLNVVNEHASDYPKGVHAWAQADRLSLSAMFLSEKNINNPRTHSLMSEDGKVGVEFPLIPFLSARMAKILSLPYHVVFRYFGMLLVLGSLLVVWWIGKSSMDDPFRFMMVLLLLYASPIILHYGMSFLPDPSALAIGHVGMALLVFKRRKVWTLILGMLLLALATAVKTSFGVYFLAALLAFGVQLIWGTNKKLSLLVVVFGTALLGLLAYYDYTFVIEKSKRLWAVIFLSQSQPIDSWEAFVVLLKKLIFWSTEYATWPQKLMLVFNLALLVFALKSKDKVRNFEHVYLGISFLGVLGFLMVFGKQFSNHDYYFIASIHPLFFLLGILYAKKWCSSPTAFISGRGILLLFLGIISIFTSLRKSNERMAEQYEVRGRIIENRTEWMRNGQSVLADLGVAKEERIFVLYEYSPNLPLVHFDRRGKVFDHGEMRREDEHITYWFNRIKPKCILVRNAFVQDMNQKPILRDFLTEKEVNTGKFTVFWTTFSSDGH